MKEIQLTRGYVALVDDEDFERVNAIKWHAQPNHAGIVYASANIRHTRLKMHRFILGTHDGLQVDHIDGDGLNNRRSNLRECLTIHNNWNTRKWRNGKSQFKGAWYDKRDEVWRSGIMCNGKKLYLGTFHNELDAARAYDWAASKLFGQFARLNFPKGANNEP